MFQVPVIGLPIVTAAEMTPSSCVCPAQHAAIQLPVLHRPHSRCRKMDGAWLSPFPSACNRCKAVSSVGGPRKPARRNPLPGPARRFNDLILCLSCAHERHGATNWASGDLTPLTDSHASARHALLRVVRHRKRAAGSLRRTCRPARMCGMDKRRRRSCRRHAA